MKKLEITLFKVFAWIFTILAFYFAGWFLYYLIWFDDLVCILAYLFTATFLGAIFTNWIIKDCENEKD